MMQRIASELLSTSWRGYAQGKITNKGTSPLITGITENRLGMYFRTEGPGAVPICTNQSHCVPVLLCNTNPKPGTGPQWAWYRLWDWNIIGVLHNETGPQYGPGTRQDWDARPRIQWNWDTIWIWDTVSAGHGTGTHGAWDSKELGYNGTEIQWVCDRRAWYTMGQGRNMDLGHNGLGTHWDWGTMHLGHNGTGIQLDWDTRGLVHNGPGTHWDETQCIWDTMGLGYNGARTQWTWYTLG